MKKIIVSDEAIGGTKKAEREAAAAALLTLKGISIPLMKKAELDALIIAIGQLLGVISVDGKVK